MTCWTCRITIESDGVQERYAYGASSHQALALAAGILPSLILTLFPGEEFEEEGLPVVLSADV